MHPPLNPPPIDKEDVFGGERVGLGEGEDEGRDILYLFPTEDFHVGEGGFLWEGFLVEFVEVMVVWGFVFTSSSTPALPQRKFISNMLLENITRGPMPWRMLLPSLRKPDSTWKENKALPNLPSPPPFPAPSPPTSTALQLFPPSTVHNSVIPIPFLPSPLPPVTKNIT